ncbi:hypothetical protein JM93_01691 [Roseibium hamelinense]|uniref:Uncharacterized protein n=1 Tax=Roseibium hamelinense TaxID=150831 RepID=A0A562T8E8_9HYPH|nr:hypothetical protein [Roseibium hamelinense]MTI42822.1 hypothetical protein [Roseibium hamelinense]TWI89488.1 hypothetical protein JM93_01691 [Roseibium hamelinense]
MPSSLTIVTSLADAERVLEQGPSDSAALCFSPDGSEFLKSRGHATIDVEDLCSSFTHARNLITATRMLQQMEQRLLRAHWHPADTESVRMFVFNMLPSLLLVRSALKNAPAGQFTVFTPGTWVSCETIEAALKHLAPSCAAGFDALLPEQDHSKLNARLALLLNRLILKAVGNRPKVLQLDRPTPFTSRVSQQIAAGKHRAAILSSGHPGHNMLATLRRGLRALVNTRGKADAKQPIRIFRTSFERIGEACPVLPAPLVDDETLDEILSETVTRYLPRLLKDGAAGEQLAKCVAPNALVLDHLIQPSVIRAQRDLTQKGVATVMINHGTDTAQTMRISSLGAAFWARHGRVNAPGMSDLFCKSPLTAPLAPQVLENAPAVHAITVGRLYQRRSDESAPFEIVMAGNFRIVEEHIPWVTELPGEFLRGIIAFAEALAQIPDMRLVIKMKAKKTGVPLERLSALFKEPRFEGRVLIDTDTPLSAYFETMDLLVGNNSATLQEALNNRIPVFLNTWRRHYTHFPACFDPPSPDARSAAYAVKKPDELVSMLRAIKEVHNTPLTDSELDGLVWTQDQLEQSDRFLRNFLDRAAQAH